MLTFLILLPLITALVILAIPGNYRFVIRCVALLGTLETAIWAAVLFFRSVPGTPDFQFEELMPWISAGGLRVNYHVGLDGISVGLVLAAAWVGFAATAISWDIERENKLFYILLLLIISGAIGAFASLDLFFFYFFNELALVPTFIMIGVWGWGEDRQAAAFRITLYLTLGALVALVGLVALYVATGTLDVTELKRLLADHPLPVKTQLLVFPCLLFGFGTLVGLWPFHSWAPQGYACAPAATAMMHAGILKKAGLLALLRVAWPFLPDAVAYWMPVLAWLCLGNLLFCGFVALRQRDLNLLIGNSSLAHMGFAFLGLASMNVIGLTGTVLVMVAHAFLAGLSFALTGWVRHQTGTVDMPRLGGLLRTMPFVGSAMILCFMAGCGVPGFANFAGELGVLFGAWKGTIFLLHPWVLAAAWGALVVAGVYMMRAIRQVLHGELKPEWHEVSDANSGWRRLPFVALLAALVLFGVAPGILTRRIEPSVVEIIKMAGHRAAPASSPGATAAVQP